MRRFSRIGLAALLGLLLTLASRAYERVGPAPHVSGEELCQLTPPRSCVDGALQAGWPLAYLRDQPGVSRVGQLAFVEDRFLARAFALDALILGVASWVLLTVASRSRR